MIGDSGKSRQLAEASWEAVRDTDRGRVVAILPVGATEAHGPHLPLSTDTVIAEAMARAGAAALEARGIPALILPALAYTPAGFAEGFPGTISVAPETLTALVVDVARSLARHGFGLLAIANAHLDPAHLAALHAAAGRCREAEILPVVFPDLTRKPWGSRLSDEFRSGACHAGRFEGSVVLAERPELVNEPARLALPALDVSLADAIRAGRDSFEAAGMDRAYCGDPAGASADEGRETVAELGAILADAVAERAVFE